MKKLSYSFLSLLMLIFVAAGCSKGNGGDDAASLLRTIPADASSVALFNIATTVEKLGGHTDGSTIDLPKEHRKAIEQSQALKDEDKQHIIDILEGETGMALNTVVYFSAARTYITGLLNDPEKFIAYEQKQNPSLQWRDEDGGKAMGPMAVVGNQFWICTTGTPDVDQLKYYQQLAEKQSYASSDAAKLLLNPDKVLNFVADVNRSLAMVPNGTYVKMASALIFDDMTYVAGSADIRKNSFLSEAAVLNSDMKPSELLLPVEKVDVGVIKSFEKGGDIYFAAGVPKKLVKKISDLVGSMTGGNSNPVAGTLEAIDGTVAVRANSGATDGEAIIQTTGENFTDLSNVLTNRFGVTVTRSGNTLTAVYGSKDFTGSITPAEAADMLKGAWIGWVSNGFLARDVKTVIKLSVDKKSLRLDFEADGGLDAFITAITK